MRQTSPLEKGIQGPFLPAASQRSLSQQLIIEENQVTPFEIESPATPHPMSQMLSHQRSRQKGTDRGNPGPQATTQAPVQPLGWVVDGTQAPAATSHTGSSAEQWGGAGGLAGQTTGML
jgi:hypothetical protein